MNLKQQDLLKRAIPPIAKRLGSTREQAWEILQTQNDSLDRVLSRRDDPELRQRVNEWWKQYRREFQTLGLGILKRVSSPSKLPEPTYDQLICLVWLTDILRSEQLIREWKQRAELVKPELTLWQRISKWFRNFVIKNKTSVL